MNEQLAIEIADKILMGIMENSGFNRNWYFTPEVYLCERGKIAAIILEKVNQKEGDAQ